MKFLQYFVARHPHRLIRAWAWVLILVVDHLPEFCLEGIVGLVYLSLEVRLDGLGGKHSGRPYFFLVGCIELGKGLSLVLLVIHFLWFEVEPFLLVQTPVHHSFCLRSFHFLLALMHQGRIREQGRLMLLVKLMVDHPHFIRYFGPIQRGTHRLPSGYFPFLAVIRSWADRTALDIFEPIAS